MMLVTTMIPVILILVGFYFFGLKKIPKKNEGLAYIIVVALSFLYFLPRGLYFAYMGIGNLPLGVALVWVYYNSDKIKFLKKE